jgi:hypothetical protein
VAEFGTTGSPTTSPTSTSGAPAAVSAAVKLIGSTGSRIQRAAASNARKPGSVRQLSPTHVASALAPRSQVSPAITPLPIKASTSGQRIASVCVSESTCSQSAPPTLSTAPEMSGLTATLTPPISAPSECPM